MWRSYIPWLPRMAPHWHLAIHDRFMIGVSSSYGYTYYGCLVVVPREPTGLGFQDWAMRPNMWEMLPSPAVDMWQANDRSGLVAFESR